MALAPVRILGPGLLLGVALACQSDPSPRSTPRVVVRGPAQAQAAASSEAVEIGPRGGDPEVIVLGSSTPRPEAPSARPAAQAPRRVVHETVVVYQPAPPAAAPRPVEPVVQPPAAEPEVQVASVEAPPRPAPQTAPRPAPVPSSGSSRTRDAVVGAAIGAGVGAVLGGKNGALGGAVGGAVGGATGGTAGAVLGGVLGGTAGRGGLPGRGSGGRGGGTSCPSSRMAGPVFDLAGR